jgi:hypothetical protein
MRYLLTEPRYIRLKGQAEPHYVVADIDHPFGPFELPDDTRPDPRLVPYVEDAGPTPPLIPAHAPAVDADVPNAAQVYGRGTP